MKPNESKRKQAIKIGFCFCFVCLSVCSFSFVLFHFFFFSLRALLTVWAWASYLNFLRIQSLIYTMKIIILGLQIVPSIRRENTEHSVWQQKDVKKFIFHLKLSRNCFCLALFFDRFSYNTYRSVFYPLSWTIELPVNRNDIFYFRSIFIGWFFP